MHQPSLLQELDGGVDGSENYDGNGEQARQSEYLFGDAVFIHLCISELFLQTLEHGPLSSLRLYPAC